MNNLIGKQLISAQKWQSIYEHKWQTDRHNTQVTNNRQDTYEEQVALRTVFLFEKQVH